MAEETAAPETAPEPQESADSQELSFASESDLARVFQDTSPISPLEPDVEKEAAEEKAKETPAPQLAPVEDPRFAEFEQRSNAALERAIAAETRANILEARINAQHQNQPPPVEEGYSLDKFREEVAKNPAEAIYKLFENANKGKDSAISAAVEQAKQQAVGVINQQNAFESDRATLIGEYGALMKENSKFENLANSVYEQITANSPIGPGGKRWHPGAMYSAASIAYAQLHKNGQLVDTSRKVINLNERKPRPENPLLGNDRNAEPTRAAPNDIPPRELAIMKKTANSMGLTLDKYLGVLKDLKKSNPFYGSGQ